MILDPIITILKWLNPLIYLAGLVIAIWAFRKSLKRGYILLAIYFALCTFSLLAMPSINRAINTHRTFTKSEEVNEKIDAAVQKAVQKAIDHVRKEEGYGPSAGRVNLTLPVVPLILVFGVWMVAKKEKTPNKSSEPT